MASTTGHEAGDPGRAALDAVFRLEFPRLVAWLARRVGDLDLAEDLAQDAVLEALDRWPRDGVPRRPGAWLTTVASRRAVDRFRRDTVGAAKLEVLAATLAAAGIVGSPGGEIEVDVDEIADDQLRMMFLTCHPDLPVAARSALTLRLVGGLTTAEIARAYLQPEATVAQRIVRAKKRLAAAGVGFEVPTGAERAARLGSVLEVVYLVFNEGYTATGGSSWIRPDLCHEALRLARLLVALAPDEPEVHGLRALLELQASRLAARVDADGAPVLLADQDRGRWDPLSIRLGLAALERARSLLATPVPSPPAGASGAVSARVESSVVGSSDVESSVIEMHADADADAGVGGGAAVGADAVSSADAPARRRGPYVLQAEVAACHARATRVEDTDWVRIVELYGELVVATRSPIVELNRAVALSMAVGPEPALAVIDHLGGLGVLDRYHLFHSVRGDLLSRLDRHDEAAEAFARAVELTDNDAERELSRRRRDDADRAAAGAGTDSSREDARPVPSPEDLPT